MTLYHLKEPLRKHSVKIYLTMKQQMIQNSYHDNTVPQKYDGFKTDGKQENIVWKGHLICKTLKDQRTVQEQQNFTSMKKEKKYRINQV